uniref:ABC-2 type transporter transmembrane domain-containing protein n=1 Tax=Strigamia maritima TaxID=126957 RepID=T1IN21_STRMM
MRRSTLLLIFQFLVPVFQICAFGLLLNDDFHNIPIAVFNEDKLLGSMFLKEINTKTINQLPVDSIDDGVKLVLNGEALATIHIWSNFSGSLIERFQNHEKLSTDVIQASSIHIRYDTTSLLMTHFLNEFFYESSLAGDPIYGLTKANMRDFLGAAVVIGLAFLQAAGLSAVLFIIDKTGGLLDRNYVSGVTSLEVLGGHVLTQLGVIVIQLGIILVFATEVFGITNHGSVLLVIILSILSGTTGMCFGFLISTICNNAVSAIMLSVSILFPNYFISGLMVSTITAHEFIQTISPILPLNLPFEAIRWIMLRGRGFTWTHVWLGFLVMFSWLAVFLVLSVIVIYLKRRF